MQQQQQQPMKSVMDELVNDAWLDGVAAAWNATTQHTDQRPRVHCRTTQIGYTPALN